LRGDHKRAGHADKAKMHLNFDWTTAQVLWTVTFAALLVLLVVLLGRERYKRFKWFTITIVLVTFRLLASRLLYGKMAPLGFYEVFIPLGDLSAIVSVLVLVELARRAFVGLQRRAWIFGTLAVVAVGAGVVAVWGAWPAWKTLTAGTTLAVLGLMQLVSQKAELLVNVMTVELGLAMLLFGRRYKAGWRSHPQGILIGLSTLAIAQLLRDGIWELIALKAAPHSQAEYEHLVALREKLFNASEVVFLAAVVWWIACLWMDEPGVLASGAIETPVVEADGSLEIREPQNDL
jgi:hypothetical protein